MVDEWLNSSTQAFGQLIEQIILISADRATLKQLSHSTVEHLAQHDLET